MARMHCVLLFAHLDSHGREIRFDLGRLEGYRNFCNKIWNAARYVLMNTEEKDIGQLHSSMTLSLPDQWILSRLQDTIQSAHDTLATYRFDLLAHTLYEFTWNEFCDWYLVLSKPILMSADSSEEQLRGTRHTLIFVLEKYIAFTASGYSVYHRRNLAAYCAYGWHQR